MSLEEIIEFFVHFVERLGYIGIFIMTLIESTFIPIPAEVTMIPAGYLVHQGRLNGILVFLSSLAGSVGGAYINYWIARRYGRHLFTTYGKYFMLTPQKLAKIEKYFVEHGGVSVFSGRLLPGIKHYISFPAGLAQMPVKPFLFYCVISGAIWMGALLLLGYFIGANEDLIKKYLLIVKGLLGVFVLGLIAYYTYRMVVKKKRARVNQATTIIQNPTQPDKL